TDIWAFGCVLFEMLTGRRAYAGESQADVFTAILSREPDWSALPPVTPPRVRELLEHCLQKDVRKRLRDMGDARAQMEKRSAEVFVSTPPAPGPRRRLRAGPIAAAVAVAALVAAGVLLWRSRPPAPKNHQAPENRQLAVFPFRNLTGDESA